MWVLFCRFICDLLSEPHRYNAMCKFVLSVNVNEYLSQVLANI